MVAGVGVIVAPAEGVDGECLGRTQWNISKMKGISRVACNCRASVYAVGGRYRQSAAARSNGKDCDDQ